MTGGTPRVVISAPSSGHGKTAVSVGLLAAFAAKGLRPAGFKVGPDYVDASYLGLAAGRPGRNLDPRLVGVGRIGPLFAHGAAGAGVAVVEGTMGLYDGLASRPDTESTAQIAGLLRAPVILVVDVAAMGQSTAALVHGFRTYDELLWLGGVILTRVASSRHERLLRETLADIGVPVLGSLKRADLQDAAHAMPARTQGVAPVAHRNLEALRGVARLGEVVGRAVDLERILNLARSAPHLASEPWSPSEEVMGDDAPTGDLARPARRPVVALAGAYGYPETAELLTAAGAEVVGFDPLRDDRLPDGISALVVPAGLPESYADLLSANERLRDQVAAFARTGRPVAAEGAGLLWLGRSFDGRPMCGVLPTRAVTVGHYVLGYREAVARSDSALFSRGTVVTGHKLHRTVIEPRSGRAAAWAWEGGPPEGYVEGNVFASQLAVHWAGSPTMAARLMAAAVGTRRLEPVGDRSPWARPAEAPVTAVPVTSVPAVAPAAAATVVAEPVIELDPPPVTLRKEPEAGPDTDPDAIAPEPPPEPAVPVVPPVPQEPLVPAEPLVPREPLVPSEPVVPAEPAEPEDPDMPGLTKDKPAA